MSHVHERIILPNTFFSKNWLLHFCVEKNVAQRWAPNDFIISQKFVFGDAIFYTALLLRRILVTVDNISTNFFREMVVKINSILFYVWRSINAIHPSQYVSIRPLFLLAYRIKKYERIASKNIFWKNKQSIRWIIFENMKWKRNHSP